MSAINDLRQTVYNIMNHNPEVPKIPNREKYQYVIPVIPDLHILYKEPSNRTNFTISTLSYLLNISEICKENQVDALIQTGDLHDRGEKITDTLMRNFIETALREINDNVKDGMFIVMGNHELTYMHNNLFYNYTDIQSNTVKDILGGATIMYPTMKLFTAVDNMDFGDVMINFMHFDPKKRYAIKDNGKYNINIYHDDIITFETEQELYHHKLGHGIKVTDTNIMNHVNVAICGHIHTPVLPFNLNNPWNTLMIVPGSLTQRTVAEKHEVVDIPVICLSHELGVVIEYIPFNLGPIKETMIEEVVVQEKKVRATSKAIKDFQKVYSRTQDLEDLIQSLPTEQAEVIRNSDKELQPITLVEYYSQQTTIE